MADAQALCLRSARPADLLAGRGEGGVHAAPRGLRRKGCKAVDAFYAAAMAAGGKDNGPPVLRPYHPDYYGAFVFDPDGNNVEAVCHKKP